MATFKQAKAELLASIGHALEYSDDSRLGFHILGMVIMGIIGFIFGGLVFGIKGFLALGIGMAALWLPVSMIIARYLIIVAREAKERESATEKSD